MNHFESIKKSLGLFMALLLTAVVVGCGGGNGTAAPAADTTAPTVSSTTPANAATGVALNANITATFSEAMTSSTVSTATFTLKQGATVVTGAVTYAGNMATFKPTNALAALTTYTATISTGVKDLAGNAMAVKKSWTFNTAAPAVITAPTVISIVPASGVANVALNANVTATFSQAMDPLTITATTFTLNQGLTAVSGVVTSPSSTTATFTPNANLAASTTYTATITAGVKDLSGTAMAGPKTWSFTTSASAPPSPVAGSGAGTAPVVLGTAGNYAILAKTGVSTVPTSLVTGNVGVSPYARGSLTGWSLISEPTDTSFTSVPQVFSPFKLYAADNVGGTTSADLSTAVLNMGTAYTDAAGRKATSAATTNVGAGTLTSLTLAPGVYEWGSNVTIPTDLTLNGTATDVWIFKVAGTLGMAAAKNVILSGGALPQNIFWQVSGAVTIGANTHFEGIILGMTSITFGNLSSINGRLLAQTAVVLDATTVTQP